MFFKNWFSSGNKYDKMKKKRNKKGKKDKEKE